MFIKGRQRAADSIQYTEKPLKLTFDLYQHQLKIPFMSRTLTMCSLITALKATNILYTMFSVLQITIFVTQLLLLRLEAT